MQTNGGVVLDLNKAQTAKWVQEQKGKFIENFSATATIKDRAIAVIVEYVPISYFPEYPSEHRKIESDSQLLHQSIITTRWIKLIERRTQGQRSAHLIAKFKSTEAANKAIRDGIVIAGKRTRARKLNKEPRRCLKCQRLNVQHLAATCTGTETCSTCGGKHRSTDCIERSSGKGYCISCKSNDHASWNRLCPKFIEATERIKRENPESTYKFFPDANPWTWEQI